MTIFSMMQENSRLRQPRSLLYGIAAGIGGPGLNTVAEESLVLAEERGFLGRAIALANRQNRISQKRITTLRFHPARALSFLPRPYAVGARKHAVADVAARWLRTGQFDLFHGWSGDALEALREAERLRIPSVLEIPTWHRNKGKIKPAMTKSERERAAAGFPKNLLYRLLVTRQQVLEEYDRATLLLVLSEKAKETFVAAGIPKEKLFMMHRAADPEKFQPAEQWPEGFRAIFVGALVRRKGIATLLEAWRMAALPEAELVLVGQPQPEVEELLRSRPPGVIVAGHVSDVAEQLRRACLHVFPSELEGSAKATYEAAACGLPQITTREAGDVVVHGETGWVIPAGDAQALAGALKQAASDPWRLREMGRRARQRVLENFTWEHFRRRLLEAYALAIERARSC